MVSARADVVAKPEFKRLAYMDELIKQAEFATYAPPIKQTPQLENILREALESAMALTKSPEQALKDAETEVNKVLQ